jgi:hypothetical protein
MKARYLFSSVLAAGLLMSGCTDMDTYPEGSRVTSDQKEEILKNDPSKAEAGVTAIFAQMKVYEGVTGSRHNDFGYPSVMMFTDNNGMDVVSDDNGFNWTGNSMDFSDRTYSGNECKITWNTLWQMVYAANSVIAVNDVESTDSSIQFYLGQAFAARAFDYWVLAQLYQFNYADHKTSPCVPIVTADNSDEVGVNGAPRATVEEVYDLIMSDLNTAISLLEKAESNGKKRSDKRYINLAVAYGLRARANLTMENWAAAAADADKAITLSGATPYSISEVSRPTMYDSNDNAWMWGIVVAETDRIVTSGIVNWPSHMGTLNYGYCNYSGGHQINKSLYNSIPSTDVRKGWWLDENKYSANLNEEQAEFMEYIGYSAYTSVKFAPYNDEVYNDVNANDIPLMRVEEMYLIKAEGEAMSGADGKSTLVNFMTTYRDPAYTCSASSANELQDEIWKQRRVEFWGEGLAWFDIMRLKKNIDRRGAGYPSSAMVYYIPYESKIMLWRIPQSEIEANKQLSDSNNNPSDSDVQMTYGVADVE